MSQTKQEGKLRHLKNQFSCAHTIGYAVRHISVYPASVTRNRVPITNQGNHQPLYCGGHATLATVEMPLLLLPLLTCGKSQQLVADSEGHIKIGNKGVDEVIALCDELERRAEREIALLYPSDVQ